MGKFTIKANYTHTKEIIRQGAVISVFQISDHIDQSSLVRKWLGNVRFFVSKPLF